MARFSFAIFLLIIFGCSVLETGCSQSEQQSKDGRANFCPHAIPTDSTTLYFPEGIIDSEYGIDLFVNKWYSRQLFALEEHVLSTDTCAAETYRLTWLRTFHYPICVRIEKSTDSVLLIWKQCDGAGGYAPGQLILDERKVLSLDHWNRFKSKLAACDFWNQPTDEKKMSIDGAQWILEGKENTNYHVVDRNSPKPGGSYYECCDYLLSLTEMQFSKAEKY